MLSVKTLPHFAQLQKVCGFLFVQVTNICGLPRRQTQNRKFKSKTHWTNQTQWPVPSQYYNKPTSCEKKIIVSFKVTSYQESWQFRTSSALFVRHSTCHEWLASNKQLAFVFTIKFRQPSTLFVRPSCDVGSNRKLGFRHFASNMTQSDCILHETIKKDNRL